MYALISPWHEHSEPHASCRRAGLAVRHSAYIHDADLGFDLGFGPAHDADGAHAVIPITDADRDLVVLVA
jgi:hypothetical protein